MGGFEERDGVADVGAGRNADAADLGGERIGDVVAVQVHGGQHVVFVGAGENLLQHGVGDHVLDDDLAAGVRVGQLVPRAAVQGCCAKFPGGEPVAPVLERPLGELHDVALVHEGHRSAVFIDGVLQGLAHQALGALHRDRLDADAAVAREADLAHAHALLQKADDLLRPRRIRLPFDPGVDVLGILAEDHHVGFVRRHHRARHALEPAHGAQANVEVELLAQGHVQRADAAAHRRGHGALDADFEFAHGFQRFRWQPLVRAIDLKGLLPGVDFHPGDPPPPAVGLGHRGVHHLEHDRRDVDADAVALDEGNDGVVGNVEAVVFVDGDLLTIGGHGNVLVRHRLRSKFWQWFGGNGLGKNDEV